MKKLNLLLALAAAVILTACGTTRLETPGAYAPVGQEADFAFYSVDASYDLAYSVVDAAFKFERDNRAMLWQVSPEIKRALDSIRPQAVEANAKYLSARSEYLAHPVASNLTTLQSLLAHMQQISATVTTVLPKQ